ncbi:hypothetical protein ASE63_09520 [Bosea sp. Root381]|uniref:DUF2272 domain-containing protein n=1 Tax=Bosea sp. Root381 TaxID=1736524 RepID=UPI0006FF07A7|nr:DUF2272 domain-containing protein [Bosea sp. Root381]KRE00300.1 hypothetical protein ASE63_09520 [Bosea sp. Root381]
MAHDPARAYARSGQRIDFHGDVICTKAPKTALDLHTKYHMMDEGDPPLAGEIRRFWTDIGLGFPGVAAFWSAVFVSACVKRSGATRNEFHFSQRHSEFVHTAIQNHIAGAGVFHGVDPFGPNTPDVGDIIQNNRGGNSFDYAHATTHSNYSSHAAIVVEIGQDQLGGYALTVGGNEGDSIRRSVVRRRANGTIRSRSQNNYICLIKNLK